MDSGRRSASRRRARSRQAFLLGIGLDGVDGHRRITRGDGFYLEGGSQESHARMQDAVQGVAARLERNGRTIPQASAAELRDLLRETLGL